MTTMGKEQAKRKHADKTDAPAAKRAKENSGQPAPKHGKPAATKAAPKLLSKCVSAPGCLQQQQSLACCELSARLPFIGKNRESW